MIRHHPEDALLMALATGAVAHGPAVVLSAHAQGCPRCLSRLREFEAVGGVVLEEMEPAAIGIRAEGALARVDAPEAMPRASTSSHRAGIGLRAKLPEGLSWPRSLWSGTATRWRRLGPGVRWSRVTLSDSDANLHLLRVAANKALPVHGHEGGELSLVLYGAFADGGERYGAGDFIEADADDRHRPVVTEEGECICLISLEGRVAFDGPLARLLGSVLGM